MWRSLGFYLCWIFVVEKNLKNQKSGSSKSPSKPSKKAPKKSKKRQRSEESENEDRPAVKNSEYICVLVLYMKYCTVHQVVSVESLYVSLYVTHMFHCCCREEEVFNWSVRGQVIVLQSPQRPTQHLSPSNTLQPSPSNTSHPPPRSIRNRPPAHPVRPQPLSWSRAWTFERWTSL